jgi:hypothetical protein
MIRSIVRLILQFTNIVTVYNIYFWVRMYSTYSTRYIFLSFDAWNANSILLDDGRLRFHHTYFMKLTNLLQSIILLSIKNCIIGLVLTVLCFCRWIETILFFESTICDEFFSYFDVQQIWLYWINASIAFILLMRYMNTIEIITLFAL